MNDWDYIEKYNSLMHVSIQYIREINQDRSKLELVHVIHCTRDRSVTRVARRVFQLRHADLMRMYPADNIERYWSASMPVKSKEHIYNLELRSAKAQVTRVENLIKQLQDEYKNDMFPDHYKETELFKRLSEKLEINKFKLEQIIIKKG